MPRSIKLSWQPGSRGKPGYWKKFYKGKVYYFPSGNGKSDMTAYDAAWLMWERKKAEIDLTAPRRHQRGYEQCIEQWEKVLSWSNRNGDKEHAQQAAFKLADLRQRFTAPKLTPLTRNDWFEANFDLGVESQRLGEIVLAAMPTADLLEGPPRWLEERGLVHLVNVEIPKGPPLLIKPSQKIIDSMDGSPSRIEREVSRGVWRDRLAMQDRRAVPEDQSLGGQIELCVARKEKHGSAGQISAGRVRATKIHLSEFRDWLGKDTAVVEIDEKVLEDFHDHLLDKIAAKKWSGTTANDCMASVKSFVRWLWVKKAIQNLPRTLDPKCKDLVIGKSTGKIEVFTKEEIKVLLAKASDRTQLYILLMLNCGMTQKDISDLLESEVDWVEGRIIRKRSKTSDEENVPTVNYKLWPETFRLLQQERASGSTDRVLLNANGSSIWSELISAGGKYLKTDNVKNCFDRLRKIAKIDKPLKSLKKTSASLLRNNKGFSGMESLFLGHAPRSMADRHYAAVPQELLDQALLWLGQQYGLAETASATSVQQSAAAPAALSPSPDPAAGDVKPKQRRSRGLRANRRFKKSP
jgi:integrase